MKNRQAEAREKQEKRGSKMLAITDGQSQGSNLVMVNDDDAKRRSNILKSRELRKGSAQGRRDSSRGRGSSSVFDRLAAAPKDSNKGAPAANNN